MGVFERPAVTVVIPAKNEEVNIVSCLEGVRQQTLKPIECIVVDNGSTDNTVGIAEQYSATVIVAPNANIGELRNVGASRSKGNILAFLDADCVPESDWLSVASGLLEDDSIGAVGSTVLPSGEKNWVENTWYFNIKQEDGEVRYIGSANLITRRPVFERIGGFNPSLEAGEDREFSWRIQSAGLKTIHDERIRVRHLGYPKSIGAYAKRELWHGKAIISDFQNFARSRIMYVLAFTSLLLFSLPLSILLLPESFLVHGSIIALIMYVPVSISARKCLEKGKWRFFLPLAALYFAYLAARTFCFCSALLRILREKLTRRKMSA